jgi:hypothetical protein
MSLQWGVLDRLTRAGEIGELTGLLLGATEDERLAFAKEFETRVKAVSSDDWWQAKHNPANGYALIAIACLPSAARTTALLCRRDMRDSWGRIPAGRFLEIARARQLPWLGDLGIRLAGRISARDAWSDEWQLAAAVLRAAQVDPPVTEGVVRGWLQELHEIQLDRKPVLLADRLRASPYLDLLLPAVFTVDGIGQALNVGHYDPQDNRWQSTPMFPSAVAQLVAEGRLDRRTIYAATVERLVRGDRPAWLRPFALLHEALAPATDELADHALDYARLLSDAPSPIAAIAQRALRTLDDAGRLELETALEASRPVLVRKEKALVKAQLTWLDKIARREPDRGAEVLVAIAAAFDHPALDIQERALTLIERHGARLDPSTAAELADAATGLAGDLPARAAALFGAAAPEIHPIPTLPAPPPPAAMPPPITSAAEFAAEVVALIREESGVRWERVLAGVVALQAAGQAPALAEVLEPVFHRYADTFEHRSWNNRSRIVHLGEALRSVIAPDRHTGAWPRMAAAIRAALDPSQAARNSIVPNPEGVLSLRIAELAVDVTRVPVLELLATPTLVNGSLDAETLLHRLRRAEAAGRQPWPIDLEQALLRVPREVDGTVLEQARALTSPAGHAFATWLADGGLPDPESIRFEQRSVERDYYHSSTVESRRVMVNLHPARTGGVLEKHLTSLERRPKPTYFVYDLIEDDGVLTMVLPHHREVTAAWALPALARLADQDDRGDATLLPLLAEGNGPIGPAMTLALAYAFGARHESDRVAGVDAFLTLAAKEEPFTAAMGAHLGDLCADGTVKLNRVVLALTDAHRAGGSAAVWEVLATAVPLLLPRAPRGLPDLLELATQVASTISVKAEIANLPEVAAKPGSSRLVREAKRLQAAVAV